MGSRRVGDRFVVPPSEDERAREPVLSDRPLWVLKRGLLGESEPLFFAVSADHLDREVDLGVGVLRVQLEGAVVGLFCALWVFRSDAAPIVEVALRGGAELDRSTPEALLCLPVACVAV